MSGKNLTVEVKYAHPNAKQVVDLVKEFEKAGKLKLRGGAKSFLTYEATLAVSDRTPVTKDDVQKLTSLGAKVSFDPG